MAPITQRLRRYFTRQARWLEGRLNDLASVESRLAETDLDAFAEEQVHYEHEMEHFEREARALLGEWRAAQDVSAEERTEVRRLARDTRRLAEKLEARCAQAADAAHRERQRREAELGRTRKSHGAVKKYRGDDADSGRIDRRA